MTWRVSKKPGTGMKERFLVTAYGDFMPGVHIIVEAYCSGEGGDRKAARSNSLTFCATAPKELVRA
jgi:hypothetical protein